MSDKISLNIGLFKDNVANMRNSVTNVDPQMSASETLDKTNITPFIDDLENMMKAVELITAYKQLIHGDLDVLEGIGEQIREQDLRISQVQHHDINDGYQPIRM